MDAFVALARELDAHRCPECGHRMRVLAAITDTQVACRIRECFEFPARAPFLASPLPGIPAPELDAQERHRACDEAEFDQSPPVA